MQKVVKRSYDASRRRALADSMRQQVIEAAKPLFISQGYEATSMRQLADAAGVSLQTLYNAFGSKFGLFSALMDVIVAGDHEPVALSDRPETQALRAIENPERLVRAIVAAAVPILSRLNVIYPTLRAAASSDPEVAEAHQRFTLDARYTDYRPLGGHLARIGALPPHIDAKRATDILWTVLSPDVYDLFITHRGWTVDEFERWAAESLTATLLSGRPRRTRRTGG